MFKIASPRFSGKRHSLSGIGKAELKWRGNDGGRKPAVDEARRGEVM